MYTCVFNDFSMGTSMHMRAQWPRVVEEMQVSTLSSLPIFCLYPYRKIQLGVLEVLSKLQSKQDEQKKQ